MSGCVVKHLFFLQNIQSGASDLPGLERVTQGLQIYESTASRVQKQDPPAAQCQGSAVKQVIGLRSESRVQTQDPRFSEHRFQRRNPGSWNARRSRITGQHFHAESLCNPGNAPANPT
jgi:hypothetical protein